MRGLIFIDKWSQICVICTEEAIPKRGNSVKKFKNYNGNEISLTSTKFQLYYSPYVLDCPLILLQKESDWIDLLGRN